MNFLSASNRQVLSEIVYENITQDTVLFDKMFNDFGSREQGPVMALNKKFLSILSDITAKAVEPRKTVSFDQQYNNHKRNFMSYTPKHPEAPIFADVLPKVPLRNIDELIKETVVSRQYELAPSKSITSSEISQEVANKSKNTKIKQLNIQSMNPDDNVSSAFIDNVIELNTNTTELFNIPVTSHIDQLSSIQAMFEKFEKTLFSIETQISDIKRILDNK
jgi:hypothetical protein